jgi:hypothetical protein
VGFIFDFAPLREVLLYDFGHPRWTNMDEQAAAASLWRAFDLGIRPVIDLAAK